MNLFKKLMCSVSAVAVSAFLVIPVMAANEAQWKRNDKGWWYEEANGTYPTNAWKLIKDKWYYFDGVGYMVENRWIGNYYLGADGAMLVSTSTPDGYYVDATGKWIEGVRNTVNISKTSGSGTKRSSLGGGSSSSGGSGGSGGSRRSGGGSGGSGGSRRSGGGSSGSGSGSSSGSGVGTAGSTGNTTASNNTASNNTAVNNNNTTPSVNNNVSVSSGNNTVVIPSGNTGNNTVTTPNTTTPAVSTQETQVIEALKAMGLTEKEAKLYYMINAYRESLGLPKLSFSKSLTSVARAHVKDSHDYTPRLQRDDRGIQGNLHSWSNNGNWSGGAYTPDHEHAQIMWDKPSELTDYAGAGYEISVYHSIGIDPKLALDLWKSSSGHNEVIIGDNDWSFITTMGVAMDKNYSHVWFGGDEDPAGYYDIEGYEVIHP